MTPYLNYVGVVVMLGIALAWTATQWVRYRMLRQQCRQSITALRTDPTPRTIIRHTALLENELEN